jgi:hypothetical protein
MPGRQGECRGHVPRWRIKVGAAGVKRAIKPRRTSFRSDGKVVVFEINSQGDASQSIVARLNRVYIENEGE